MVSLDLQRRDPSKLNMPEKRLPDQNADVLALCRATQSSCKRLYTFILFPAKAR